MVLKVQFEGGRMHRVGTLHVATLALLISYLGASSFSAAQDLTFQVQAAQGWTDTGLDLQSGDNIKISAVSAGSGDQACNPAGSSSSAQSNLPLSSANAGALIAKLHVHGAVPILIGVNRELHIDEPSHLLLGINVAGSSSCPSGFTVRVEKISANDTPTGTTSAEGTSRGEQLKSQLSTAAQIFMSGQFGIGKSEAGSNAALSGSSGSDASSSTASLKLSTDPLDANLRKSIDGLPRRVNDQFNNLGDMVNFVIVGSQKDVESALEAANWHIADTSDTKSVFNAVMDTYDNKNYLTMPMSTLYLFGRKQDFGYEMAEPIAMVASRHHFRIWKAPFTWNEREVWIGAGTHDIGFAKDKRNNNVTHKIDPAVDGERDNIGSSLQTANVAKILTYYLPPDPVLDAKNATGDGYHSDGRLLVIFVK
jgi:hypothetical protein